MIVAPMQNPYFKWNSRRIRAQRVVIALHIHDSFAFSFFLPHDIAKDAAFLFLKPFARRAQFVFDSPRHKNRPGHFRVCMRPFFTGQFALILKYADVFQTQILLQVGHTRNPYGHHSVNLVVAQLRQPLVVFWSFHHDFVRASRTHAVVHAVRPPAGLAFNPIKRIGMRQHTHLPRTFGRAGQNRLQLIDCRAFEGTGV